jgi:hypothetical protein
MAFFLGFLASRRRQIAFAFDLINLPLHYRKPQAVGVGLGVACPRPASVA